MHYIVHNYTLIFSMHILPLSYCRTIVLSYCRTVVLSYCRTVVLSYCRTVALSYYRTVVLSLCRTVALSYCHTVALLYYRTVATPVVLSYCHTVALSLCRNECMLCMLWPSYWIWYTVASIKSKTSRDHVHTSTLSNDIIYNECSWTSHLHK